MSAVMSSSAVIDRRYTVLPQDLSLQLGIHALLTV